MVTNMNALEMKGIKFCADIAKNQVPFIPLGIDETHFMAYMLVLDQREILFSQTHIMNWKPCSPRQINKHLCLA